MKRSRKIYRAATAAILGMAGISSAAPFTWDGGSAATNNWTDAINWSTNIVPANDGTADITFAGAVRLTPNVDVAQSINSLTFAAAASPFTVGGSTLTIGAGGIANNDDSFQAVNTSITLASAQTWTSGVTIASGGLQFNGPAATINTNGNLLTLSTLNTSTINILTAISGAGGLTKEGNGTLSIAGTSANTYTGTTTVNNGILVLNKTALNGAILGPLIIGDGAGTDTVRIDASNQINDTSAITLLSSGILDLTAFNETIGSLTMTSGTITGVATLSITNNVTTNAHAATALISTNQMNLAGITRIFTIAEGSAVNDMDISATIASSGGLTKTGPGTLRLSGAASNTYTGTTTVNEGTLVLAKSGVGIGVSGPLTIGDGTGNDIVRLDADGQINSASSPTINSSGLLDLNGHFQAFSTAISLNGGVIATGTGGTLRLLAGLTSTATNVTATVSGAGAIDLFGLTRIFTVNDGTAGDDLEIAPNITNGGVLKIGAGRMVFSGTAANSYSGGTTVNEGTLVLRKPAGVNALASTLVIGDGVGTDTVRLDADEQISNSSLVSIQSSGVFDLNGRSETIGSLQISGGTVNLNSGALALFGDVSTSGSSSASINGPGGVVMVGGTRTFTVIDGVPAVDLNISAAIGNGSLIKAGPGTLQLSGGGVNTLTTTTVNQGVLLLNRTGDELPNGLIIGDDLGGPSSDIVRYGASNQIASGAGTSITINSTGLLDLAGFSDEVSNIVFNGGALGTGAGTLTINESVTTSAASNAATMSGNLLLASSVVEFAVADGAPAIDLDVPANVNQGILMKTGLGTLRLSGTNNTLNSVLLSAGTLLVNGNLSVITLSLNGGTVQADGASRFIPQVFLTGNSTVDGPNNLTFTNTFSNGGGLTKNGVGTLNLNSLTMTAPLTLNAGTLNSFLTSTDTFTQNSGTFTGLLLNQGTFNYNGGVFNAPVINEGIINFNANFTLTSVVLENRATLTVGQGRILTFILGNLINRGDLFLNGGTISGNGTVVNDFSGQMIARGNINTALNNSGTLQPSGLLALNGDLSNVGLISVGSTQAITLGTSLANTGVINLSSGSIGGAATDYNNLAGGLIQGGGGISAALTNAGGLIYANAAVPLVFTQFSGNTAGGELRIADGSTLNIIPAFSSSGTIVLQGTNATLNGGLVTNTGTISGKGRISNNVDNSGVIRAEGGAITFSAIANSNNAAGSIQVAAGASILYSQGLATNAGTISLSGGSFSNNNLPMNNTGLITGFGNFATGGAGLTNNGSITLTGGFTTINGNVTNAATKQIRVAYNPALFTNNVVNNGIFKNTGTTITFAGTYTENGTFISDPADNFFNSVNIGPSGAWVGGVGDRFFVNGDLLGESTAKTAWQTADAELHFIGGIRHILSVLGNDHSISFDGYDNNFAWGSVTLGAGEQLTLDGDVGGALYVGSLILPAGLAQISSITGNGHNIYYHLSDPANAYLGGQTYALAGGGQLAPVPEPATLLLGGLTAVLALSRRRRIHVD